MAKKKHAEEHENLERWLVSYADFMTLLFATFVVLYALSQMDLAKLKELKASIRKAFSAPTIMDSESSGGKKSNDPSLLESDGHSILDSGSSADAPITPILESIERQAEADDFKSAKEKLDKLGKGSGIRTQINKRGLVISLEDSIFFTSGSATANKAVKEKLLKIGQLLKDNFTDHTIRVEGHTDNLPIKSDIYPSNWELSANRAIYVVKFFINNFKLSNKIFAAIGYADSKPKAPNNTSIGRSKNRRVEIVVLRNRYLKSEPKIAGLNNLRRQKIKAYQLKKHLDNNGEPIKEGLNPSKAIEGISKAAQKLLMGSGMKESDVVTYKDAYDQKSESISEQLKKMEEEARKLRKH